MVRTSGTEQKIEKLSFCQHQEQGDCGRIGKRVRKRLEIILFIIPRCSSFSSFLK